MSDNVRRKNILNQTGVSITATSNSFPTERIDNVAIQCQWSNGASTPTGRFYVDAEIEDGTWTELTLDANPNLSGNSGSLLIYLAWIAFQNIRVRYIPSAGSVDLDIWVVAKEIG